jgi:hypothetical protein
VKAWLRNNVGTMTRMARRRKRQRQLSDLVVDVDA